MISLKWTEREMGQDERTCWEMAAFVASSGTQFVFESNNNGARYIFSEIAFGFRPTGDREKEHIRINSVD